MLTREGQLLPTIIGFAPGNVAQDAVGGLCQGALLCSYWVISA